MKKKSIFIVILVCICLLTATIAYAFRTELLYTFGFKPKNPEKQYSESVKENKLIKEEKKESKQLNKIKFKESYFNKNDNDFKYKKVKLDTDGDIDIYTYIAPNGIDIDGYGNLYINDQANNLIRIYYPDGELKKTVDIASVAENKYAIDWKVSKEGIIYVLTSESLYYTDLKNNSTIEKINYSFRDTQQLYIGNNGNISVLDINPETINLRVNKFSVDGTLIDTFEQYNYELNLYDYEDNSGNTIKINLIGGSCESELQYVITNTEFPGKEYLVSLSYEGKHSIKGISVAGIDNEGNIYFLKELYEKNEESGDLDTLYSINIFSFVDGNLQNYEIDKQCFLKTEGLTNHTIKVDYFGNIYVLETSEEKMNVTKYEVIK